MLIEEFSVGNYKSFREVVTLNLTAANIKSKHKELDESNVIEYKKGKRVLRSKAIYGANASGKSNIIKALTVFIEIVKNSVKDESSLSRIDPFALLDESKSKPSFFEMVFIFNEVRYRYGFEAFPNGVLNEWLFARKNLRETSLFIREQSQVHGLNSKDFLEGHIFMKILEAESRHKEGQTFNSSSLFLTNLSSFGFGDIAKSIVNAIASIKIVSGLGDYQLMNDAEMAFKNTRIRNFTESFLKHADLGIRGIESFEFTDPVDPVDQSSKQTEQKITALLSFRDKFNSNRERVGRAVFVTRSQESEGTKKIIELSPLFYSVLRKGGVIVIDEFDARLHPLLTRKIVELFNTNLESAAQLVFVTHDTNLLSADLLRRDQIDFVEKNAWGESVVYSLAQFKGIRNNASFAKDYVQGKYGAVPHLPGFWEINEDVDHDA